MLLYVKPTMLTPSRLGTGRRLVDVSIPEVGIELRGGREVTSRTPYPNKNWMVVGAKGNPPTDGLLIDVGDAPDVVTVRTRWAIEAAAVIVHELKIVVADRSHDVIAGNSTLWALYGSPQWRWDDVTLPWMKPAVGNMRLDAFMRETSRGELETVRGADDTLVDDLVTLRRETLEAPTVERDRYDWIAAQKDGAGWRLPPAPMKITTG